MDSLARMISLDYADIAASMRRLLIDRLDPVRQEVERLSREDGYAYWPEAWTALIGEEDIAQLLEEEDSDRNGVESEYDWSDWEEDYNYDSFRDVVREMDVELGKHVGLFADHEDIFNGVTGGCGKAYAAGVRRRWMDEVSKFRDRLAR